MGRAAERTGTRASRLRLRRETARTSVAMRPAALSFSAAVIFRLRSCAERRTHCPSVTGGQEAIPKHIETQGHK